MLKWEVWGLWDIRIWFYHKLPLWLVERQYLGPCGDSSCEGVLLRAGQLARQALSLLGVEAQALLTSSHS